MLSSAVLSGKLMYSRMVKEVEEHALISAVLSCDPFVPLGGN